jgi:mannose-1-phosphate guanylyltransferase
VKALLLAAGRGTRLGTVTQHIPKCLVSVGGIALLDTWITRLAAAGFSEVRLNTHHLSSIVEAHVVAARFPIRVDTHYEPELLGTAGTIAAHRDWIDGDDCLVAHADNYSRFNIPEFMSAHRHRGSQFVMTMLAFRTDTPHTCGILEVGSNAELLNMWEKSHDDHGSLANAAVYAVSPALVSSIEEEADFSTEIIPRFYGRILVVETRDVHIDIGTPESLARAQALHTY